MREVRFASNVSLASFQSLTIASQMPFHHGLISLGILRAWVPLETLSQHLREMRPVSAEEFAGAQQGMRE